MEKRLLFFFAITFVIMSVWFRVFPPDVPEDVGTRPSIASESEAAPPPKSGTDVRPRETELATRVEPERDPEGGTRGTARAVEPPLTATGAAPSVSATAEARYVVETERFRLVFGNRGGRLLSATLREYRNSEGEPYELVAQEPSKQAGIFPLDLRLQSRAKTDEVAAALFRVDGPKEQAVGPGETAELVFAWANGAGLGVTKRVSIPGDRYDFGVEVSVEDDGEEIAKEVLFGAGLGVEGVQSRYTSAEKGIVDARGTVTLLSAGDVEEGAGDGVGVSGVGVSSHYFAAVMVPDDDGLYGARLETTNVSVVGPEEELHERQVISAALVAPNGPASFRLFVGPKKLELLEALGPGFASIIEFGWMRYPALLLRTALLKIYDLVGNYGWAIVLLTVLINVVLVPLKHYSFVSMRKMQKLAPQIQKIKDRYRKVKPTDPRYQQMNQEIMGLYKEHNVNPVSGCLPMLLMIPFFFAFYSLLLASIELRQAPFFGWIQDLAVHDPFFVLPILMGVSQVATQRMTPQTTMDPVQAKVMMFMPIMFTVLLALAPAGLVLYWFSNNIVSMGQQLITNRFLAAREEEEPPKKRKGKKASKKE